MLQRKKEKADAQQHIYVQDGKKTTKALHFWMTTIIKAIIRRLRA